jgi:MFS family permease
VLNKPLTEVGTAYGGLAAVSSLVGTLGGGLLMDKLSVRDLRWLGWLPGLLLILAWPFYTLAILSDNFDTFLLLGLVAGIAVGAAIPAMFAVLHRICGSSRRAMAVAITFFFSNLLGLGFGPLITGILSDKFTASMGPVGLRYALVIAFSILLPSGLALIAAASSIGRDIEA